MCDSFSDGHFVIHIFRYSAANLPADCINLGQGYMNFSPPQWIKDAAEEALSSVIANHYSHPKGRPRLRQALKKFYDPLFGRDLDIESEILVTSGANEGKSRPSILMKEMYPPAFQDNTQSLSLSSRRGTK